MNVHNIMEEEDFKTFITESVTRTYKLSKDKVNDFLSHMVPIETMQEKGFKIDNKSDFIKGYAVCVFFMATNSSIPITLQTANLWPLSNDRQKFLNDLQDEYSKKLTADFDNID